ncbi:flagellar basal-body rod protein FlgB [Nitrobacteraceae bacterium AZCC 1564]
MPITDLPMLSALRTKMQWHQERQRVLAENVSHSDSPGFKPRDLVEPKFDGLGNPLGGHMASLAMTRTSANHIQASGVSENFDSSNRGGYATRPAGNAVNLEDEMLKASANQMDYAAVTSLYSRSLGLIKTAIGRR